MIFLNDLFVYFFLIVERYYLHIRSLFPKLNEITFYSMHIEVKYKCCDSNHKEIYCFQSISLSNSIENTFIDIIINETKTIININSYNFKIYANIWLKIAYQLSLYSSVKVNASDEIEIETQQSYNNDKYSTITQVLHWKHMFELYNINNIHTNNEFHQFFKYPFLSETQQVCSFDRFSL